MKSLVLFLYVMVVATHVTFEAVATCVPVASACPSGVAETAPPNTLPSVCSGHGTCFNGACLCNAGFADVDCGAVSRRTALASVFISQGGFDDGPTRYFDIITQVVTLLQTEGDFSIPAQEILNDCDTAVVGTPNVPLKNVNLTLLPNTIGVRILNGGLQTTAGMHMVIPVVPLNAAVATPPVFGNCCDNNNNPLQNSNSQCLVACSASHGDHVSFDMDVTFTANIFPSFDPNTGTITVSVPTDQIVITFNPPDMGFQLSCNLGQFVNVVLDFINNFVISFGKIVATQVQAQVKTIAQQFADSFALTGVRLNITDDLSVTAFVPFGEFVQDSYMTVNLEGVFQKQRFLHQPKCPQVTTTFIDRTLDGKTPEIPNAFEEFFSIDDAGTQLQTLFAGRLARSAMTVGVAALMQDNVELINTLTNIRANFGLLDATFQGQFNVNLPQFGFPAHSSRSEEGDGDFLEAALTGGSAKLVCNNTGDNLFNSAFSRGALNLRPLLIGQLSDFENAFSGGAANFKATLQVFDLDVTQLNLTIFQPINVAIPNLLATGVTDQFLGGSKLSAANDLLQEFAVPIPQELTNLAPGPRIEALHDNVTVGSDGKNGFFQFSTRCLCSTGQVDPNNLFVVVETAKFGQEIVPRCGTPCQTTTPGRRLGTVRLTERMNVYPAKEYFAEQERRRALANATNPKNASDFLATNQCGTDLATLKRLTKAILTCAERTDAASLAPLTAKAQCMQEIANGGVNSAVGITEFSACSASNTDFAQVRGCPAPANVLIKDLFGQTCLNGTAFNCTDTLAKVFADTCTCANRPSSSVCNDDLTAILILGAGWGIPFGLLLLFGVILRFFEGCCLSRFVGSEEEQVVSFFRVQLSRHDKYFLGLAVLTVLALIILTIGWVFQDPVKIFVASILNQDLFKETIWVTTTFDTFGLRWSLAIMFSLAFTGSSLLAMTLYSFMIGRCAWLGIVGNQAYTRGDGHYFIPSERTAAIWTRNAVNLQRINRASAFILINSIFAPPVFFGVRKSVTVAPPQFDPFVDVSSQSPESLVFANLTSLATSQETLDLLGQALGFTLMSSFLGFLSSLVLLVIQGAVPAAFAAASVALYWLDTQQRQQLEDYERMRQQHGGNGMVMLPPDNSDKNRWKKTLHFFTWCAHTGGMFGSLVGAILVYQTLRAPPAWAVLWILLWIGTLPGVVFLVQSKSEPTSGRRRFILTTFYCLSFFILTIVLVALAPVQVSFASPLAVIFFASMFLYAFLLLMSEYCNLGSDSTAVALGGGRATRLSAKHNTLNDGGFEIGYSFSTLPRASPSSKQQPARIKSVMISRPALPPSRQGLRSHVQVEERDLHVAQEGSFNPAFAHQGAVAAQQPAFIAPPEMGGPSSYQSWAPPIWSPMTNPMMMAAMPPMSRPGSAGRVNPGFAMETDSLRRAADRVSSRFTSQGSKEYASQNNQWKMRVSQRLQSRGVDPALQGEMTDRIAEFAALNEATSNKIRPYASSPDIAMSFNNNHHRAPRQLLETAVARTRQSIAHWGEERPLAPKKESSRAVKLLCENPVMDVLLEKTEKKENTYGLRVVPFRRMFFFVGLVMLLTVLIRSNTSPLSVLGIKRLVFTALISILVAPQDAGSIANITAALDFNTFDSVTSSLDPPLQEYVKLSTVSFAFLWVVFALFLASFVIEIVSSRCAGTLHKKRRGIRIARLFSFMQLPFLFIAVVVPSSADYVGLSLGGIADVVPLCGKDFDNLVFTTASNLFGLAMGGLLAVQTMLVLLLVVPSVQRALAFVIAKEVFEVQQVPEASKAYIAGEKRLMIARFLWRNVPFMSPLLLYIPTILIAQAVSEIYSSILVYVFYALPLLSARLKRSDKARDQKSYRWILFAGFWTGLYFAPLGLIGLVELIQLHVQFDLIANLTLENAFFYITLLAEVCLAIVVMSDVLYLFISSDEEIVEADRAIDRYMDAIEEEAVNNNNYRFKGQGGY